MYRKILRVGNKTARVNGQNFVTGFKGGMNANDGVCIARYNRMHALIQHVGMLLVLHQ